MWQSEWRRARALSSPSTWLLALKPAGSEWHIWQGSVYSASSEPWCILLLTELQWLLVCFNSTIWLTWPALSSSSGRSFKNVTALRCNGGKGQRLWWWWFTINHNGHITPFGNPTLMFSLPSIRSYRGVSWAWVYQLLEDHENTYT